MNVYQNIAYNNPDAANEICKKYGYYQVENIDELAYCLQKIVADDGENSFLEIMNLHPDKDVITEIFAKSVTPAEVNKVVPQPQIILQEPKTECSCNKLNATGDTQTQEKHSIVTQTNTYILLGALIVSMAIISMKK